MKNKEELTALKEEVETLNKKLEELTEEELAQVSGGVQSPDFVTFSEPLVNTD
ncbi:MAG: bacteriocin [Eubacteriales bacterium]|nr:bacteriocin [Eubacteriales bacterium]